MSGIVLWLSCSLLKIINHHDREEVVITMRLAMTSRGMYIVLSLRLQYRMYECWKVYIIPQITGYQQIPSGPWSPGPRVYYLQHSAKGPLKAVKSDSVLMYLCVNGKRNRASCHWQWISFRKGSYMLKFYGFLGDKIFCAVLCHIDSFKVVYPRKIYLFRYFANIQVHEGGSKCCYQTGH